MNKHLVLLFILCNPLLIAAQVASFSFRNISINEGLSQSSVVDIAVDKTGFVWFATQEGLNRYDGKDFLVFKKNFDDVTTRSFSRLGKIIPGNYNDLWLITSGGKLERMNLYNNTFKLWNTLSSDSLPLPPVSCLYVDKNDQLWIGTENEGLILFKSGSNSISRYTTQSNLPITLSDDHVKAIFPDSKGRLWILTANGITFFDPVSNYSKKLFNRTTADDPGVISFSAIDEDEEETLWLGSFGKGLYLKKKQDTSFIPFTGYAGSEIIPPDLVIETIKTDQDGKIWIGTYGKGLYLINKKKLTVQHFLSDKKKPFSIGYNDVLCIKKDNRQGIWMGTDGGGVSYYHNALNNFITYSSINLPSTISIEQVRSVIKDKEGKIWAGTSNQGLVFIDPVNNAFEQFHFSPYIKGIDIPERIVSLLCDEDGDIWVGTQANGLIIIDSKTKRIKKWFHPGAIKGLDIPDHTIWCMLPFGKDVVLTGTQNAGICVINKYAGITNTTESQLIAKKSTGEKNVRAVIKLNDSIICVGYEREGIKFFDVKAGQLTPGTDQPLQNRWPKETILKCLFYQPPFLLAGTSGEGLMVYHLSSGKINWITEANGLPNNTIYGILKDKMGYLWLSSNKGLCRFRLPQNPAAINRSDMTVFNATDGLQSNEFNTGAYYASDSTLFFGGVKGLNLFNPSLLINTSRDIPVVITQVTINNEVFSGDTTISAKKTLKLKYHENSVSFNFAALNFLSGSRLNYSYRLSGYEQEWIEVGNRNYAAYTNLSPGNYHFEVRTPNQENNGYGPVTQLSILITPPYWQTWWFILACIVCIIAALYALYRYRINQLLQLQNVRSRIAADLHDDIGSTLTNINILSELSKKNIDQKREATIFLNRITEEVNVTSQALDDIVWSINKDNDTIEQTIARMRRHAAEIFEGSDIAYSLQSGEQIANRRLSMEIRRDFFLLFKEAINNVYKHAKATRVEINVWLEKKNLQLQIRDNGTGFDTTASTHRNGIKGMHTRVKKWKGHIHILSEPGKGTLLNISLPVS